MDTKAKGKSTLNPNAAPFVPFSNTFAIRPSPATNINQPLVEDKEHQQVPDPAPEETQDSTNRTVEYKLPDSISFDYEGELTDEQRVVENISNMYPEIPWDFINEFAGAHDYDFDLTVDMLEQFYVSQVL
jgi:Ataxin-2 C-terminal region